MEYIALLRHRPSENASWLNYFKTDDPEHAEENMRNAVTEFLSTPDGIKQIEWTNEDFNWGDAVNDVPDDIWNNHHLTPITDNYLNGKVRITPISVDQDEILIPDQYFDEQDS